MKFFIDTANIEEIEEAASMGIIDGITTNPTLLSREKTRTGKSINEILEKICSLVDGPINLEVTALYAEGMVKEARELQKFGDNVVIKVPMITEGIKAVKILSNDGINTNVTLIFSPSQALIAAKAGASFVTPFIGRLDDISSDGMRLIEDIITIFDNYGFSTEVLVGSVRHPMHVHESGLIGADIVTMPFNVLQKLFKHPLTDIGLKQFMEDWKKVQ